MTARCTYPGCDSFALNISPESGLCDVHFYKVQRDELLGACIQMCNHYSGSLDHQPAYVAMARAAIAKVTGGTT